MKRLYLTSFFTGIGLMLFFAVMKIIPSPLGGEPYSVLQLKDRSVAEKELRKKLTAATIEKRKAPVEKEQKQNLPHYFKKEARENQIIAGGAVLDKPKTSLEQATIDHKKSQANQLKYIANIGLPLAPIPEFVEVTKTGDLPKISDDGRRPMDAYARPSVQPSGQGAELKTIAIVFTGLGFSQSLTQEAIETLPPEITLSFIPYSNRLKTWTRRARNQGHELVLEIPMEPFDYPDNDPGPHTLLSNQTDQINLQNLKWLMSRMPGYVGVLNLDGNKLTSQENVMYPLLREINNRGLLYMDRNPETSNVPYKIAQELKLEYVQGSIILDDFKNKTAIDDALKRLEKMAHLHGTAIGITTAMPLSIQRVREWSEKLKERGFTLVPLTHMVRNKQS